MTKEEILNKHHELATDNSFVMNDPFGQFKAHAEFTIQYSDLQNNELTERLVEKDNEIERLKAELNEVKKQYSELCDVQKKLCEQNISLDSELNELKERHKKDVEMAYGDGKESIFSSNPEEAFMTNEQYYKQNFEK